MGKSRNTKILDAVTVDSTTNATKYSSKIDMTPGTVGSLHFIWTGTPTSTISLWESNKGELPSTDDTDWVQDTNFSVTSPAGSASKSFVNFGNSGARWIRIKVVTASGSGTFTCWANHAKG